MILFRCSLVPLYRLRFIFIYTPAVAIAVTKHILCIRITLFCRFPKPFHGFFIILFCSFSIIVAFAQFILCSHIALLCGFPIPENSLARILFHTKSGIVAVANAILCDCYSLFCGFFAPHRSLFRVFFYAFSCLVAIAKSILCLCKSLLCGFLIPFSALHKVFCYAIALHIANAQIVLRSCIALFCRLAVAFKRLLQVFCDTCAMSIAVTQFFLCLRIALPCRLTVQFCGLCLVLADAITGFIALAQFTLRFRAVLLSRFCIPLYSHHIVRECHIQLPGHILCRHIALICSCFVPFAGLFVIFFNAKRLIIAFAQCALRLRITLLGSFFVPCNGIFRILCYTNTVLVTPCHFQLRLWASVITGRNHVALKRHLGIANLLKIIGILQIVLLGFLLRFLLCFLPQTKVLHEAHEFSLFILRPIEQEAVYSVFLSTKIHILDFSPQTAPLHTASRRFKPFFNRFYLDGIRDFHLLPIHTDRLQFIRKTYFHLNFAHNDSLPMYL